MKKNAGKAPSIQFYYKDFLADMSEHEPEIVGAWLLVLIKIWHTKKDGAITKTLPQYAKIMNTDQVNAKRILSYFDAEYIADVTICNDKITVVNRRTKRDAKLLEQNRLRQQRFRNEHRSNADVAPPKANPSSSSSSSSSYSIKEKEFLDYWNSKEKLPKIKAFSKSRQAKLKARLKEQAFVDGWPLAIDKLAASPFHTGENDRGWRATVDFLIRNDTKYIEILEMEARKPKDYSQLGKDYE